MPRALDISLRARAYELFDEGRSNTEVAASLNVSRQLVRQWRWRRTEAWQPTSPSDQLIIAMWEDKTRRLKKENEKLRLILRHHKDALSWRKVIINDPLS
jgi:orotate phosphoribosyltransferase-like protein